MKISKILLQSNLFYFILIVCLFIYILITTVCIKYDTKYDLNTNTVKGVIKEYSLKEEYITLTVKSDELIKVTFYFNNNYNKDYFNNVVLLGSFVTFKGTMSKPLNNSIPNTFNYKKYLYNNKIFVTFRAKEFKLYESKKIYHNVKYKIHKYFLTFKSYNYLNLFILGNKDYLDNYTHDLYKINGVAHLLAISGMHITLFVLILEKLLIKLNKNKKRLIIISFLMLYVYLTNFGISILRCVIFYILKEYFDYKNLHITSFKILLLTMTLLLLINPFYIYSISFLYSFIITFGLILCNKDDKSYFKKLLYTSSMAFLLSLPITVSLNYEINILSILNNIILVPIVTLLLYPLTLLTTLFKCIDPLLMRLWSFFEVLNDFLYRISININIPKMSFLAIFFYYLLLYIFITLKKKIIILYLFILFTFNKFIPKLDSSYQVIYFDVGQGDSSVLISPYQKEVIMIDTGGNIKYKVSDNVILYLKSISITKIDIVVLTHGDYDHVGEIFNIYNKMNIKNIIINNNELNDIEKEIVNLNINLTKEINTKYFKANNLNKVIYKDENTSSLVFLFNLYNNNFLFTGDIPIKETKIILNDNFITTNYLKISHHGSKHNTDEEIIKILQPKYAIISAGRNNIYNHPSNEIINILKNNNVIYYTTQEGSIIIKIWKHKTRIRQVKV